MAQLQIYLYPTYDMLFNSLTTAINEICNKFAARHFFSHLEKVCLGKKLFSTFPTRWMTKQQTNSIHDLHNSHRWVSVVPHLLHIRWIQTLKNLKA